MDQHYIKVRENADEALAGDVVCPPEGGQGICVNDDGHIVWKLADEDESWWLHRARCQRIILADIAERRMDGKLGPNH